MTRSRRTIPWLYLVLAYGLAWIFWIPVALTGQNYQESPLLLLTVLIGVFGPGLAGIILTYREEDKEGKRDFWRRAFDWRRIRLWWCAVIVLLWPALHGLAIGINSILGGQKPGFDFVRELVAQPLQSPVVVLLYFAQAGLEELGWRGYMLERIQPTRGPLRASLLVGIFHAFWHLPTFWIVGTNQIEMGFGLDFLLFVAAAVSSSVYETWCYYGNGRSTLAATLLHTTGNLAIDTLSDGPGAPQNRVFTLLMALGAIAVGVVWTARGRVRPGINRAESPSARRGSSMIGGRA
jgi:membrane protease YdiL (CAAX protease family)